MTKIGQQRCKQGQYSKESKGHVGKRMILSTIPKGIITKDTKQHEVLIGQDYQNPQKEANGKRRGETSQHKGSQNGQTDVNQTNPNGGENHEPAAAVGV